MNSMSKQMENKTVIATRVSDEQYEVIEALMGREKVRYRSDCRIAHTIAASQVQSNQIQAGDVLLLNI